MEPILKAPAIRPTGPPPVKWAGIVEFLKQHRGEWALVGTYSVGVAPSIRRGDYRAFLPYDFVGDSADRRAYMSEHYEVTTNIAQREPVKRSDVYIRWLG